MDDFTSGGDNLRDASFSYLRSEQNLSRKSTSNRKIMFDHHLHHHHQDQGEISVFGAEKYFNMLVEDVEAINTPIRELRRKQADHSGGVGDSCCGGGGSSDDRVKSVNHQPGTPPSACSEMSWNSRSALLLRASTNNSMASGEPSRSRKRRVMINWRRSIFATLGCAGACSDKKSVHVDHHHQRREEGKAHHHDAVAKKNINEDQAGDPPQQPNRLPVQSKDDHDDFRYSARSTKRSEDHFAFPILSGTTTTDENKKSSIISTSSDHNLQQLQGDFQEPPRMSLEVFGSKTTTKAASAADEVVINLERKLSVLTWDAIPTKPQMKVPPKAAVAAAGNGRPGHHDQDMDSDASSDLFEIENITVGSTTSRSLQLVSDIDNNSRCETPNHNLHGGCYEPSEASIEWSVVTASVADLGSVIPDYDEKRISANFSTRRYKASKSGGGILGCKSQKSVRVAESTYRSSAASKEIVKSSNV